MARPEITGRKSYLGRAHLGTRYGKCTRTIKRWKEAGILPPPDLVMNGFDFWLETTIDEHDRKSTAEAAKQPKRKFGPTVTEAAAD